MHTTLARTRSLGTAHDLAAELRQAVATGRLSEGEQLPTIRRLMDETGLTYSAVSRAFSILQAEGLLVSRKRAGTYVAGRDPAEPPDPRDPPAPPERSVLRVFALIGPELSSGFYPSLQKGFDLAAGQRGFQIIASTTHNDVRVQSDTIQQLMVKSVAGIAIVPATLGPPPVEPIRQLQRRRTPVVMVHRPIEGVRAPLVTIPAEEVGELAGRRLVEQGHRRIAYCASQRAGVAAGYERGLRRAMAEAGLEPAAAHIHHGDFILFDSRNYARYEEQLGQWFTRHMLGPDRPTALFTSFETIGEFAYLMAIQHGLRVPEDLSIVTVGGEERRGAIVRRLACITIDEQNAGALTADLLDQMQRGERPIESEERFTIEIGFDAAQTLAAPAG